MTHFVKKAANATFFENFENNAHKWGFKVRVHKQTEDSDAVVDRDKNDIVLE